MSVVASDPVSLISADFGVTFVSAEIPYVVFVSFAEADIVILFASVLTIVTFVPPVKVTLSV